MKSWMLRVLGTELSLAFSYRLDFWLNFLGRTAILFASSFCLWQAIYASQGVAQIGSFSFSKMLLFSLLAPVYNKVAIGAEFVGVQRDIYDGGLNRYLLFPLPYGLYKWLCCLAQSLLAAAQALLVMIGAWFLLGEEVRSLMSWSHLLLALLLCVLANGLYFLLASTMEMMAFWQDNVWSLIIMLRFLSYFLGGVLVPLELYPASLQVWVAWTPFAFFAGIPLRIAFADQLEPGWVLETLLHFGFWLLVLGILHRLVWRWGNKSYTGVGI